MSRRYLLSEPAAHDLDLINSYLVEQAGVAVARHVLREIRSAVQFLAANPGVGHLRDDVTDQPVKFWPVFSYLVIYNPSSRPLEILRVLHASRDVVAILEDSDEDR